MVVKNKTYVLVALATMIRSYPDPLAKLASLTFIMPPTLKKLEGHIAFGLSVCLSVCVCVNF